MSREAKFAKKYDACAGAVLKSIDKVRDAGRSRDAAKVAAEQARHASLMASLP